MNKIATFNYDLTDCILDDQVEKIASIADKLSKEAREYEVPAPSEEQSRNNSDFALVTYHSKQGGVKKYAKYSKEITEINLALLDKNHKELPDEIVKVAANNLLHAAKQYGIEYDGELSKYAEKDEFIDPVVSIEKIDNYAYTEKVAEKDKVTRWALPSRSKYPIDTEERIKEASVYFHQNNHLFSIDDSIEYAQNVKQAAEEEGIELEYKGVEKFASLNSEEYNADLPSHIDVRKSYLMPSQEDVYELYEDFTKRASDLTPRKAVSLLEAIDKEANLTRAWGKGIENPAVAVFGVSLEKEASAYPGLDELRSLDNAELTTIIGNSDIAELKGEDGVDVYKTLPLPIKREVDKLLNR